MSELPGNWSVARLGDIASDIAYGFTTASTIEGTHPKLLRITDIQDGAVNWDTVPRCTDAPDERVVLRSGDIVIARTGATTGKSYLIDAVPDKAVFASYLIRIRLSPQFEPRFAWAFMQSKNYWSQIQIVSKGTAQPGANASILSELSVPTAPLPEQRRIVAKIDSLSAKSARACENLDHIPRLVAKYKQTILLAAFRGDLTQEWRRRNGSGNVRAFDGFPEELDGRLLPSEWSAAAIADAATNHDGRRIPVRALDRAKRKGEYAYYGASGIIDQIDDFLFDGDFLLIGEDGANLLSRSTPIAFLANGKFWVNNHAHVLEANDLTSNHWLCWFINMIDLAPYVTGSAQPKLTQAALNRIVVPLPTMAEQAEILRLVDAAFSWTERLAKESTSARKLVDHLDQAVLAKAFQGQLVPQDQNDEPAAALLERIKAGRESAPAAKR